VTAAAGSILTTVDYLNFSRIKVTEENQNASKEETAALTCNHKQVRSDWQAPKHARGTQDGSGALHRVPRESVGAVHGDGVQEGRARLATSIQCPQQRDVAEVGPQETPVNVPPGSKPDECVLADQTAATPAFGLER